MSTHDPHDDDRPRRRRRDDDGFDRDDDEPRPRRRRRRYRDDAEEDYADDFRPRAPRSGDGLGIAAMITGILSLLLDLATPFGACLCPFVLVGAILGLVGGVVAIVLGFTAWNRTRSGMGMTGIITGFLALLAAMALIVLIVIGVGFLAAVPVQPAPNQGPGFNQPRKF